MRDAIYATGWDGNMVIRTTSTGDPEMQVWRTLRRPIVVAVRWPDDLLESSLGGIVANDQANILIQEVDPALGEVAHRHAPNQRLWSQQ